jgi:GNAT superfamily N-acetyltransferase
MIVRKALVDDCPIIAEFNRRMAWETEGKQLDPQSSDLGVKNLFSRPDLGFYQVAELDEQVVGSLMVTFEWSDWRNGLFWWVQSVFVRPEFRKCGVFRTLYEDIRRQARESSVVCGIRLYVFRENHVAISSYQRLGMNSTEYLMMEEEFPGLD